MFLTKVPLPLPKNLPLCMEFNDMRHFVPTKTNKSCVISGYITGDYHIRFKVFFPLHLMRQNNMRKRTREGRREEGKKERRKEGRKDARREGGREGRKEREKEGRKEGKKEGRNEGKREERT